MKTYKIVDNPILIDTKLDYTMYNGMTILEIKEISDLEFNLLMEDIESLKYKASDFNYCKLVNDSYWYILKSDILEEEFLTIDEATELAVGFGRFLAKHTEISYNPIINKWDTNIGIGFQTNSELFRLYLANKSKLSVYEFTDLLKIIRSNTKNMCDDDVVIFVDEIVKIYPDLLRYRDLEWYYNIHR